MRSDLDADDIYAITRRAIRDAIWDVLGTIAYLGFITLLVLIGLSSLSAGLSGLPEPGSVLTVVFGGVVLIVAVLLALDEFGVPPFR